jgi:putative tryptophan/tyrosine transport system substrate-binding protein
MIGRREFITLLGGAAATWPMVARAQQQSATPAIGMLTSLRAADQALRGPAFAKGLAELDYVEGRNVTIEYRYGDGQFERLASLAADLVRRKPAVIAAISPPAALAAKAATTTIPIAFMVGLDPVRTGLVASLNRPEANLTGTYIRIQDLGAKRLGLLRELVPGAALIGALAHPGGTDIASQLNQLQSAAHAVGQQIFVATASSQSEINTAFAALVDRRVGALIVLGDVFFFTQRDQIVALAARYRIPTIYHQRDFVEAGGLMSYATSLLDGFRLTGNYVGRLLKGAKPGDLPVQQASKVELVINLKTAKALGLELHPQLLATVDEVIE